MLIIYVLYKIVPLVFLIFLVNIFIDVLLDHSRKGEKVLRRVMLYSSIFLRNKLSSN